MKRIVIYGNAGSGKTTLAKKIAITHNIPYLCMDTITWTEHKTRLPVKTSKQHIDSFIERHTEWVIEGCYGTLVEMLLPAAMELLFLNPGIAVCQMRSKKRSWEPEKFI